MASEKLSLFPGPENSRCFFPGYHWEADSGRGVRRLHCPPEPSQSHTRGSHVQPWLSGYRGQTLAYFTGFLLILFLQVCIWEIMNKGDRGDPGPCLVSA